MTDKKFTSQNFNLLSSFFDEIQEPYLILDLEFQIVKKNKSSKKFFKNKKISDGSNYLKEFPKLLTTEFDQFIKSKTRFIYEWSTSNRDLSTPVIHTIKKLKGGYVINFRFDILPDSPSRLNLGTNQLLNSLRQGILVVSKEDNKVVFMNDFFMKILGMELSEMEELDSQEQIKLLLSISSDFESVFDGKPLNKNNLLLNSKDGSEIFVNVSTLEIEFNEKIGLFLVFEDISELVNTLRELKESTEKYKFLFERMPEGVLYEDAIGQVIDLNPAGERILGLTLEHLQGIIPMDPRIYPIHLDGSPYTPDLHPTFVALRTGLPVKNDIIGIFNLNADKYKWISMNATPEFRPGEQNAYQVFVTFSEITEQIEAKRKLKEQSELLELLVSTSTSFINVPEAKLNETIQLSIQKFAKLVDADRMFVFDYNWKNETCSNTLEWCAEGISPQLEFLQEVPIEGFEDWKEKHLKGELVHVEDVLSLGPETNLRQILKPQGIKSLLSMPIMIHLKCVGFLVLGFVKKYHSFSESEINLLKIFSDILANVNIRLKSERLLNERIKELNVIYEVSNLTIQTEIPSDTLYEKIVEILPSGFFEPKETSTRLIFENKIIESSGFQISTNSIAEKIFFGKDEIGVLEVFLPKGRKFLPEESTMLLAISNSLNQHLEAKKRLIEIRNSEERFKNLVNSQTNFVLRTNLKGEHTYWNNKFEAEFGWIYVNESLYGADSLKSICGYDQDKATQTVIKCLEVPGKVFQVELDKNTQSGKVMTTLWDFVCLTDMNGDPFEMQCIGIDISDRKKTEKKLQESEEKYRFLFEESPDGYLIIKDGKFIDSNKTAEKMILGNKKDLVGKSPADISPEIQPNGINSFEYGQELIEKALKDGLAEFEWVHLKKDGTEFLNEIKLSKIEREGEVVLFTTWRDITEKRKTEIALIQSEERFSQIAEHSGSVVWETDQNGLFTYLSPVSERVFGYTPEELIGKKYFWDIFPDNLKSNLKRDLQDEIRKEIDYLKIENPIQRKDGNIIWISRIGSSFRNKKGEITGYRGADNDITPRKIAEDEMRKFRTISDQASYGTVITEYKSRKITYCNKAFAKMHGYEIEELIGKQIFKLHTPEQIEFYFQNIYPGYEENGEYNLKEFERLRKDGSTFTGLASVRLFYDGEGNPLFNAATVIDITDQKKNAEQIQEQNLRLKAIIEAIPDILYVMDIEGNYLEYFSSDLGNKVGDFSYLVGKNLKDAFLKKDAELHLGKIKKSLRENRIETYEYAGMIGFENRFFESRLIPMTSDKVLRFVREITERKKSESEIRKLKLAIEQSPVSIIITDLEGKLEYFNTAFLKMTGYSYEEIQGKPIGMIKSGLTDRAVYNDLWKTISSGKNWHHEWRNRKKSEEIFWENISITPILDESNQIKNFLAVKQDITERKRFEEEIIGLNLNLEKKIIERTTELEVARNEADSANQAKSDFLSRMSHELRTPMNSILGFAQLLDLSDLKASQRNNLEYILKSGEHLLSLINEVLEITQIESGKMTISLEPVELVSVTDEIIESVRPFASNQSISISFSKEKISKIFVLADLQRLRQILINFLNNAIKYNKKHGFVKITLEEIEEINGRKTVRINIADSGIGISEENLFKLFKPFERIINSNIHIEGTGLGLSVVEKLSKLMGGKVGVESKIGEGSKFWVELPMANEISKYFKNYESEKTELNQDNAKTGTILLVEDNLSNTRLIHDLLKSIKPGIKLVSTVYGMEALDLAKKHLPSLILLDLNLPDISGSKVLEMLKMDPKTKGFPIIVLTADATLKQKEELLVSGAEHYITKPFNIRMLIKLFDQYLTPKSYD